MANFGYEGIGPDGINCTAGGIWATGITYSPAEDGVLDSMSIYAKAGGVTLNMKMGLYDEADDSFVGCTIESDDIDSAEYLWRQVAADGVINVFAAKTYRLCVRQSENLYVKKRDSGGPLVQYDVIDYPEPWPDPIGWSSSNDDELSFFATYTPSGGGQTVLDYERKTRGHARGIVRGLALWLSGIKRTRFIIWLFLWSIRHRRNLSRRA